MKAVEIHKNSFSNKYYSQHWVCCYGGVTNNTSAMCRHQQQFQRDEQHSAVVLIINNKTKTGQRFGAGRSMKAATAASPVR